MSSIPQRQNFFEGIQMEDLYIWRHIAMAACLQCEFLGKMPGGVGFQLTSQPQQTRGFVFVAIYELEDDYINGLQPGATIYANLPWYMRYPYHWIFLYRSPFLHGSTSRSEVFNNLPQSHLNFLKQHPFGTQIPDHISRQNLFEHPSNAPDHPIPEEITGCVCSNRFEFGCPASYHRLDDDILIQQMMIKIATSAQRIFCNQHSPIRKALFTEENSLWSDRSDEDRMMRRLSDEANARMRSLEEQSGRIDKIDNNINKGVMRLKRPQVLLRDIVEIRRDSSMIKSKAYQGHDGLYGVDKTQLKTNVPVDVFSVISETEIRDDYRPTHLTRDVPADLTAIIKAANSRVYLGYLYMVNKIVRANGGRYDCCFRNPDVDYSICRRHDAPDF